MKQNIKLIRLIVATAALIGLGIVAFKFLHKQSAEMQIQQVPTLTSDQKNKIMAKHNN